MAEYNKCCVFYHTIIFRLSIVEGIPVDVIRFFSQSSIMNNFNLTHQSGTRCQSVKIPPVAWAPHSMR